MALTVTSLTKDQIHGLTERLNADPFQPLYFIRGLNPTPINLHLVNSLEEKANSEKNLCFKFENQKSSLTVLAEYLPWDSNHFGFGIAKVSYLDFDGITDQNFSTLALTQFISEAKKVGVSYIISSLDVRRRREIHTVSACGFIPIEFRAHYFIDLKSFSYPKRFKVRLATSSDVESLSDTAANTENPYDRFFGDPKLDPLVVKDLMRLWVKNSIVTNFADGVLVPEMENPKAFCTFKSHKGSWEEWGVKLSQPILAAVSPELSGWYVKIMSELSYHLRDLGAEKSYLTTQQGNLAVIRTWEALNYNFGGSEIVSRWTEK